jgi:crossover junction endodeoxyribonuclease RusA
MNSITITISLPPKGCRPNGSHGHWRAKSSAKKLYRKACHLATLEATQGHPPQRWLKASAQVSAYFPTARHMDPDNLIASLKAAFDGIADAGIVANDKGLWPLRPIISKDAGNPRVEITITPEHD